ncbi:uncharacterized protein LOC121373308 [Gigantopelta aegis]|uniref:uncharacterized protein LOC121373308 n=1 Tax=Gigantopelta aegis TaxID=1735272 RepID=UPI001B88C868|nr:uncharacterized protein LOC121373308 [Gigantopelta aegis]
MFKPMKYRTPVSSDASDDVKAAIWAGNDVMQSIPTMLISAKSNYGEFGEKDFKSRYRSLELSIINGTDRCLHFKDEYFREGTWFVSPQPLILEPGAGSIAFVATKQRGLLTGVGGGLEYLLEGTDFCLYMGFTNPVIGCYKTFIQLEQAKSAKWAYDNSHNDTVKRHRNHGYFVTCTLRPALYSPFRKMEYTIIKEHD